MQYVQIVLFILISGASIYYFIRQARLIYANIRLGRPESIDTDLSFRLKQMFLIAFGQKKMFKITSAALLHLVIYVAFLITQIELIEVFIDGIFGKHRAVLHAFHDIAPLKFLYFLAINAIEVLSLMTFFVTLAYLSRRNLLKLPRLSMDELKGWPMKDANLILIFELILIICIFSMNIGDRALQLQGESSLQIR